MPGFKIYTTHEIRSKIDELKLTQKTVATDLSLNQVYLNRLLLGKAKSIKMIKYISLYLEWIQHGKH